MSSLTRVREDKRATVKPTKSLLLPKRRTNGRNNNGHITCRHKGGGHNSITALSILNAIKKIFLHVWPLSNMIQIVPPISLLNYADGEKRYIFAPQGLKVGDIVQTSDEPPFHVGCCMKFKFMPLGSVIHNIEMYPGRGANLFVLPDFLLN